MTVPLVSSFQQFVLSLAPVFTQPSFANFVTVLTGWAFCLGRHTVTNIIVAASAYGKHFSCYHRFFARARWCPDAIGRDLLMKALEFVPDDEPVVFAVDTTATSVLETIAMRWSIEVSFRNMKQSLGLEDPQSRKRLAVERTAPTAMTLYSLTVMWYAHSGHVLRERCFKPRPWYRHKTAVSFDDMIATLRQASWTEVNFADPAQRVGSVELTGERLLHMHTSLSRGA